MSSKLCFCRVCGRILEREYSIIISSLTYCHSCASARREGQILKKKERKERGLHTVGTTSPQNPGEERCRICHREKSNKWYLPLIRCRKCHERVLETRKKQEPSSSTILSSLTRRLVKPLSKVQISSHEKPAHQKKIL